MSLPLAYRPEVRGEIDEAYAWYEQQRAGLGEDFLAAVDATLDQVKEHPEHHAALYRDVRAALVRRFPYVVYYRVESERIVVVAVQHASRNPRRWKSRV